MNRYLVIGMIGLLSGILCARADVPLAWSGRKGDPVDAAAILVPLRKCGVRIGGAMGIGCSLFAIVLMCAGAAA